MAEKIAKQFVTLLMAALVCVALAYGIVFYAGGSLAVLLVSAGAVLLLMLERALPAWPPLMAWAWGGAIVGLFIGLLQQLRAGNLRKLVIFSFLLGSLWWVAEANGRITLGAQIKRILRQSGMLPAPERQTLGPGVITASHVTLRQAPSTSSRKLGTLSQGQTVEIVNRSGDWYQIRVGTLQGYVHHNLLKPKAERSEPAAEELQPRSVLTPNQAQIILRSHPPASVTINGKDIGQTEAAYVAAPGEKLRIRFATEGYDVLEIEQTAPPAGGMTIVEQVLRPTDFPYGRWQLEKGGAQGELIFARGKLNFIVATARLPEQEDTQWQGRFNPVDRTLRMNQVTNATTAGRWHATLSDDLRRMNGEIWLSEESDSETFTASWMGDE